MEFIDIIINYYAQCEKFKMIVDTTVLFDFYIFLIDSIYLRKYKL